DGRAGELRKLREVLTGRQGAGERRAARHLTRRWPRCRDCRMIVVWAISTRHPARVAAAGRCSPVVDTVGRSRTEEEGLQTRRLPRMPVTARPGVAHPVTTNGNDPVHASPYRETADPGARVGADGRMTRAGSELLALQRLYGNRHVQRLIEQHRNRADGGIRHTSAGRHLPDNMRSSMERAFGTDLHDVRLHEGPAAS